jgi:hypothetical protein
VSIENELSAFQYRKLPGSVGDHRRFGHSVTIIGITKKLKTNWKMVDDADDQDVAHSAPETALY